MSVPVKAVAATASLSLALMAASASAFADTQSRANAPARSTAEPAEGAPPTAQDPSGPATPEEPPAQPDRLDVVRLPAPLAPVPQIPAPRAPVAQAVAAQVPMPRFPFFRGVPLPNEARQDFSAPMTGSSPQLGFGPMISLIPYDYDAYGEVGFYTAADLSGVRDLRDLRSLHALRRLHGRHRTHALRELEALPGLGDRQRRVLRLALVRENVRHRRAQLLAGWRARASRAVRYAFSQRGRPYVYGGTGGGGFDCSGLVQQSWRHAGVRLARVASAQFHSIRTHVSPGRLKPGDLLYFNGLGHVGMYVGHDRFIHSPHTGDHVRVARFDSYYRQAFVGATRPAWHPLPRVPTDL